jgi:sulfotransferase
MKHEFFFYSGLPRAGGTMLASVLNQHPDLHVTPLSPTVELLYYTEKYFDQQSEAYSADAQPIGKQNVLENIPQNYYAHVAKHYVMDNNRAWPNNVDRIQRFITADPKIVCIVRDIPSILASFVDLVNRSANPGDNFIDRWLLDNGMALTTENRCYYLMQPTGIVNQSLWSMYQGYSGGHRDKMHIVEYDDLVGSPDATLASIVDFLGLDQHEFDFENIVNVTPVDDVTYNLAGMHSVRSKLASRQLDPMAILGADLVNYYSGFEYWRSSEYSNKYCIFGINYGRNKY